MLKKRQTKDIKPASEDYSIDKSDDKSDDDDDREFDSESESGAKAAVMKKREKRWKPAKFISFETIGLTSTKLNPSVRPCGFKENGRSRVIKSTCLLARMKKLNMLKK